MYPKSITDTDNDYISGEIMSQEKFRFRYRYTLMMNLNNQQIFN